MEGVAIIVGHRAVSSGVVLPDGSTEWQFNTELARQLEVLLSEGGARVRVFRHPEGGSYKSAVRDHTVREVNRWAPQVVVALHSNAAPWPVKVNRSLALHWPSSKGGKALAALLSAATAGALGLEDRGPVAQDRSWSKSKVVTLADGTTKTVPAGPYLYVLKSTAAPAALLESHFMVHVVDGALEVADGHRQAVEALESGTLAQALAQALLGALED